MNIVLHGNTHYSNQSLLQLNEQHAVSLLNNYLLTLLPEHRTWLSIKNKTWVYLCISFPCVTDPSWVSTALLQNEHFQFDEHIISLPPSLLAIIARLEMTWKQRRQPSFCLSLATPYPQQHSHVLKQAGEPGSGLQTAQWMQIASSLEL